MRFISLGFPIAGEQGRNLHYILFVLVPTLHSPGIVNAHCQLNGGSATACPSSFATWTLDHTIFCQTHFVCSNILLNTFIPSLSLELRCLVLVIIFLSCYVCCAIRWQSHHARLWRICDLKTCTKGDCIHGLCSWLHTLV